MKMPSIIFIDDEPDDLARFVESLAGRAEVDAMHPEDVTAAILKSASLVLVDSRLDHWPERDALPELALKPLNGKALAAVLRAHAESSKDVNPTAFALFTAHLEDYSEGIRIENREHSIARSNNLEWVFRKNADLQSLTNQFLVLAAAVTLLPKKWPLADQDETDKLLGKVLELKPEAEWTTRAMIDVVRCHPPIRELNEWTHGMELLRWLLHRILPYPCFLWDRARVAARLRMSVQSFETVISTGTELGAGLSQFEYTGIANQFLGRRWWRAGIESFLWNITDGKPFDVPSLQKTLARMAGTPIDTVDEADSLVCIDQNYGVMDDFFSVDEAVRLMPDDWPSYADVPWTPIELAKNHPEIRAAVIEQDQEKLR